MAEEFRRNLMGPEPTLLPEESDVVARLAAHHARTSNASESGSR
ncbi:hypothetical protein [Arthrobacter cheniae]|nr:hypothetical protein [Arthrobacter cheniae]